MRALLGSIILCIGKWWNISTYATVSSLFAAPLNSRGQPEKEKKKTIDLASPDEKHDNDGDKEFGDEESADHSVNTDPNTPNNSEDEEKITPLMDRAIYRLFARLNFKDMASSEILDEASDESDELEETAERNIKEDEDRDNKHGEKGYGSTGNSEKINSGNDSDSSDDEGNAVDTRYDETTSLLERGGSGKNIDAATMRTKNDHILRPSIFNKKGAETSSDNAE